MPTHQLHTWGGDPTPKYRTHVACALLSCYPGMSAAVSRICRERRSRDVYVVGAANVGKSAFVRAMLKEMARSGEPVAIGAGK